MTPAGSALATQAALFQAAWVAMRIMMVYRALEAGAGPAFLGALASVFAFPALVAAPRIGRWTGRFGGARVSFAGLLALAGGCLLATVTHGLEWLMVAAVCTGLGHVAVSVGQQVYVAHRSRRSSSDTAFASLTAAASLGQMAGPLLVVLASSSVLARLPGELSATTMGLALASLCVLMALPLVAVLAPRDAVNTMSSADRTKRVHYRDVLHTRHLWRALAVGTAVNVTLELTYTFVPIWGVENGIGADVVGWLLTLRGAVSFASRLGLERLVQKLGRKALLLIAISVGIVALIGLPLSDVAGGACAMVALGVCLGMPQPLTMAWVVQITERRHHGAALGLRLSVNRLAQVTIPAAVAGSAATVGVAGVFWANAALLTAAAAVVVRSDPG
ncbi:MAG: MFS transporter [Mycobacterium sp.]